MAEIRREPAIRLDELVERRPATRATSSNAAHTSSSSAGWQKQSRARGGVSGTPELIPLRSGCSGGFFVDFGQYPSGGGAAQFSSAKKVDVNAVIDVRGANVAESGNIGDGAGLFFGGGGAGGSLLVEAPEVVFGANTRVLASGGNGAGCASPTATCTGGGIGASAAAPATAGTSIQSAPSGVSTFTGGGGGGLGRVRVNTRTQSFTLDSAVVINAALTTGEIASR